MVPYIPYVYTLYTRWSTHRQCPIVAQEIIIIFYVLKLTRRRENYYYGVSMLYIYKLFDVYAYTVYVIIYFLVIHSSNLQMDPERVDEVHMYIDRFLSSPTKLFSMCVVYIIFVRLSGVVRVDIPSKSLSLRYHCFGPYIILLST